MRKAIEILIGEMESKLGGYAALLNYRFLNLCVKAEPVALLSITVEDEEGEVQNLDDLADAMLKNDYQFEVIPRFPKQIPNICKGFLATHPEFKQEVVSPEPEDRLYQDKENEQHIILTVPEVNQDRHDTLMDAVKVLYDQCKVQVDKVNGEYSAKLAAKIIELPEEEMKEAKDKLAESQQMYVKLCDDYLANKQKEIEDAYQHFQEEQAAKKAEADELAAARGEKAGQQLQLNQHD